MWDSTGRPPPSSHNPEMQVCQCVRRSPGGCCCKGVVDRSQRPLYSAGPRLELGPGLARPRTASVAALLAPARGAWSARGMYCIGSESGECVSVRLVRFVIGKDIRPGSLESGAAPRAAPIRWIQYHHEAVELDLHSPLPFVACHLLPPRSPFPLPRTPRHYTILLQVQGLQGARPARPSAPALQPAPPSASRPHGVRTPRGATPWDGRLSTRKALYSVL